MEAVYWYWAKFYQHFLPFLSLWQTLFSTKLLPVLHFSEGDTDRKIHILQNTEFLIQYFRLIPSKNKVTDALFNKKFVMIYKPQLESLNPKTSWITVALLLGKGSCVVWGGLKLRKTETNAMEIKTEASFHLIFPSNGRKPDCLHHADRNAWIH